MGATLALPLAVPADPPQGVIPNLDRMAVGSGRTPRMASLHPRPAPTWGPTARHALRYSSLRSGDGEQADRDLPLLGVDPAGERGPSTHRGGPGCSWWRAGASGRREARATPVQQGSGGGCSVSLSTLLQRHLLRQI